MQKHLIQFWKKIISSLNMFENFSFGGKRLLSGMSEACAAISSEYRNEKQVSGSCSPELEYSPQKFAGWDQGICAAGYRPNFRDSSITISSVCQYYEIRFHQQMRLLTWCIITAPTSSKSDQHQSQGRLTWKWSENHRILGLFMLEKPYKIVESHC